MDYKTLQEIALLLDPTDVFGNDWRMVAHRMGFTFLEIRKLEREAEPTKSVLLSYKHKSGKADDELLVDLCKICSEIGRQDVVEAINIDTDVEAPLESDIKSRQKEFLIKYRCTSEQLYVRTINECTRCMRDYFTKLCGIKTRQLQAFLEKPQNLSVLKVLRNNNVLTEKQFSLLCPSSGSINIHDMDLSLLYILVKNIALKDADWSTLSNQDDPKPEHDVVRIKDLCHRLSAVSPNNIQVEKFETIFNDLSDPLRRLGGNPEYILQTECSTGDKEDAKATAKRRRARLYVAITAVLVSTTVAVILAVSFIVHSKETPPYDHTPTSVCEKVTPEKIAFRWKGKQVEFPFVSRDGWGAKAPLGEYPYRSQPVPYAVIAHTAGARCNGTSYCCMEVKGTQKYHMKARGWDDIGYNFMVGGDGVVYEGTGWDQIGRHTRGWNYDSIGVAFTGNFETSLPPSSSILAARRLLQYGAYLGKLTQDYVIYAHCQVSGFVSPGAAMYAEIRTWDHWQIRNKNGACA
ncbi:uncharacterized protein LOC106153404 [Lingula anatina]|uniref:Uncharacterized protein LOC106153404 n=1 Tax=Lingula anatina TaxID=7574 RepID=A0A1S3HC98_LINAN|nr:uncharacterized protein LOC106153404 [Lingula anatina]|eukprot:XP_013382779.1 uncharacterized protein LOC106153404 [Lingula anatina]